MNILQMHEIDEYESDLGYDFQPEAFAIENIDQVTWAFRKIKAYLAKKAEIEETAKKEIQRIKDWQESELKGIDNSIAYFEGLLTQYAVKERQQDPKLKISTPYGKVGFRKQQPKWEYKDDIVLKFLKESGYKEFIRIKEEVNKAELKKSVQVANGQAVTSEGEVIEGITVIPQDEKIEIKVV